ncbi:DUF1778 domain-containing protein [Actinoplanes couchii]|uniref:type II toxin-antitoxin system TacA family antitoxin n=1 Tax=Actinoplanes couchii TaxID=403638 RepID=UPI001EF3C7C5|nr:DUF1778 domain-containing protein [Actinoplanes couchii]MDR6316358.1 uncharacterized protein (DUF1778 family) [Actinoplanes couchii]
MRHIRRYNMKVMTIIACAERRSDVPTGVHCAYDRNMEAKAERLHLRLDTEQKALLEAASRASGASVSTFVLKAATDAAADVLADRRVFLLDEEAWQVFDEALQRPEQDVTGLRELMSRPTILDARPDAEGQ